MKAVVSGAGIAGLAAAHALKRAGWQVVVVERGDGPRTGGYMIDFFGPGYDAAEDLGVLPALAREGHAIDTARFVDATGRTRSVINYALARKAAGGRLFPILRGDIERALLDTLPEAVQLRYATTVTGIDNRPDGVDVTLSDGTTMEANLLVGADGIHSATRERIFGPDGRFLRFLGYHTAAYFFRDEAISRELEGQFTMFTVPDRLVGLYDIGDGTLASFFVTRAGSPDLPADPRTALRDAFGGLGWLTPQTLAAAPEPSEIYYDLVAQVEMPRWHINRTVLVGDAAYAVSLLAGQGASMAIAGANALGRAVNGGDIAQGLERLESRLRPTVTAKQRAGRRTAHWFVPPGPAHVIARDLALNLVNSPLLVGLLGRFFSFSSKGFTLGGS